MAEQEPSLLRADGPVSAPRRADGDNDPTAPTEAKPVKTKVEAKPEPKAIKVESRDSRRPAQVVQVVGFWKRALAATVDLAIVIPTALLITWLASKITGVRLPSGNIK